MKPWVFIPDGSKHYTRLSVSPARWITSEIQIFAEALQMKFCIYAQLVATNGTAGCLSVALPVYLIL